MVNKYRCTRRRFYLSEKCDGFKDWWVRDGYYVKAETAEEALKQMAIKFPNDHGEFDLELWDKDCV